MEVYTRALFDLKFDGNQERMLKTQLVDEREGGNNGDEEDKIP